MLSCIENEFNLQPVHFNNSRALIARLKGFHTFPTEESVYRICMSVYFPDRKRGICLSDSVRAELFLRCGRNGSLKKAVQFIYQIIETTTENFSFLTIDFLLLWI